MEMKVEVVESTLVAPSDETPRLPLWLSNIDLVEPKLHTPMVYYYPAPTPCGGDGFFSPDRLRAALAKALVQFFPLAGRLGVDAGGRLQIDCNREGALFVVARAGLAGKDLFDDDYKPSPELRRMLVPPGDGQNPCLAMFQVTFLKCGGVVLGTAIHHVPMDGVGCFHFMQTWAALARGAPVPPPPCHDRTPLRARSPPRSDFSLPVYVPRDGSSLTRPFATRVYSISPKFLAHLKSQCAPGVSTYSAVAAHLWRCTCAARGLDPAADTRLSWPANVRQCLRPQLPPHFSGNAIVRNIVAMKVGDVLAHPLGDLAAVVRKEVERVDDAYARSVIDYLEMECKEDDGETMRIPRMSESDMWVVSLLGMPIYDADFGWGAPRLVASTGMLISGTAWVTRSAHRDAGILLQLTLEPESLQRFHDVFYGDFLKLDLQETQCV